MCVGGPPTHEVSSLQGDTVSGTKKSLAGLGLSIVLLLMLAACGDGNGSSSSDADSTSVAGTDTAEPAVETDSEEGAASEADAGGDTADAGAGADEAEAADAGADEAATEEAETDAADEAAADEAEATDADEADEAAAALIELEPRTIGVLGASQQSESIARFAQVTSDAAAQLGWDVLVVDGENNPQVWADRSLELVTQQVDAILTIAIDAPAITPALEAAAEAGIPVIAVDVSVAPVGRELFDAVYSDDDARLGAELAQYAMDQTPGAVVVGQTASVVYAADLLVQSAAETLEAGDGTMAEIQDIDVTDLFGSFAATAVSLVQGNPDAQYLVSCCDFSPLVDLPAFDQAGVADVTLLTRYENDSSMAFIRDGAPLVVVAANTERTNLQALDVLADYFANGTPIPETYPGDNFETSIVDASNAPADGRVFPIEDIVAPFVEKWSALYTVG